MAQSTNIMVVGATQKVLFMALLTLVSIFMATSHVNFLKAAAIGVLLILIEFLGKVWYKLLTAKSIYRIYSFTAVPENWLRMTVTACAREQRNRPIESISELSAISGGSSKDGLSDVGSSPGPFVCTLQLFVLPETD